MAAPNLSISVQPKVANKVTYLRLAPKSAGAPARFKLVVRLDIVNGGEEDVTVNKIEISFPNSGVGAIDMVGIDVEDVWAPQDFGPTIAAGQTKTWSNGIVTLPDASKDSNVIYLGLPAPAQINISVWCAGFSSPAAVTFALDDHSSQNGQGYYLWPLQGTGSKQGFPETFYVTSAIHWANGGPWGNQIFAHDIGLQRYANGSWTQFKAGTNGSKNEDYLIWGKQVLAMAAGVVETVFDQMDENTTPGSFPIPTPDPACGNHVIIQHGAERTIYCHLQKGSIPTWLHAGSTVNAHEFLGKVGNTGNSTNPHIHIEASSLGGYLRPLPFRGFQLCDRSLLSPPAEDSPWSEADYAGIPQEASAITYGPWTPPARKVRARRRKTKFAKHPQPSERKVKKGPKKKSKPGKRKGTMKRLR